MRELSKKIKSIPRGVKASVAYFTASVISAGIQYITTPLYTRLLTPDEYGMVSVFLTWLQIFNILATFNLGAGVFNNGMVDYPDKRDEYSLSMLMLSNIITVCFFLIVLSLYPFIKVWLGVDLPLIVLMAVILLFRPAYNFWTSRQRYELKYEPTFIWSVITAFVSPAVALVCMVIFKNNRLYARIFGAELALVAVYVIFYVYLIVKGNCKVKAKYWKAALLFNLPLIPHYLSMYLLGSSDKIMISNLVSDSATAYYSVAYTVSSVAVIIWNAANGSLIPYTYEKCSKKDYKSISSVVVLLLMVFAAACIGVTMLAPEVVAILATPNYMEAIYAIPPIVCGVFFQVHYSVYANILFYYKKPQYVTVATIITTVLNIVLNYIFIKKFGYIAAGYTTLVCYLVQAILDYAIMRKTVGDRVYNMRQIGLLSAGVIAVSLLSNFIYNYIVIRYAIIVVLLALCILFRKRIIGMLKQMKSK